MKTTNTNFIRRLQSGKEDALDYIVDEYLPLIKSVVQQVLRPLQQEELIDECVNDAFLAIWQNANKFRDNDANSFKNWICAVAKFKAIDYYRREVKNAEIASDILEIPVDASIEVNTQEEVEALLRQLDPTDRTIFIMRYLLGFNSTEIAEKLEMSKSAIDNRIYRGKKKLRTNGRVLYEGHI